MWLQQTKFILSYFNQKQSLKLFHKLLLQNMYKINQTTLSNGTNQMSHEDFKIYYKTFTKLKIQALNIATQLFCHPICTQDYQQPCHNHYPPRTLK